MLLKICSPTSCSAHGFRLTLALRMREPNSGALRSHWTSAPPPGKKPDPGGRPCEFGPERDSRKPTSIQTYPIATLRSKASACGQSFRLTTTWMIGGGRIDMSTFRAVPLGRAPIIPTVARSAGRQTSAMTNGEPGNPLRAADAPRRPGDGPGAAFNTLPQVTQCDECGSSFTTRARRSKTRPRLYCPEHQYRPGRRAGSTIAILASSQT
jgi:hypothetical protein